MLPWFLLFSLWGMLTSGICATFLEEQNPKPAETFTSSIQPIPETMKSAMVGSSWKSEDCPVPLSDLVLIELSFWGFDDTAHQGHLIVHKAVAEEVVSIFQELFDKKFPIQSLKLIDDFKGDDSRFDGSEQFVRLQLPPDAHRGSMVRP